MGRSRKVWYWLLLLVVVAGVGMAGRSVLAFPAGQATMAVRITGVPDVSIHPLPAGAAVRVGKTWWKPTMILLGRDGDTWHAFANRSTHMGEPVRPWPEEHQFRDDNGSVWDQAGRPVGGPTPRGLDGYPVTIEGDYAIVDLSRPQLGEQFPIRP